MFESRVSAMAVATPPIPAPAINTRNGSDMVVSR